MIKTLAFSLAFVFAFVGCESSVEANNSSSIEPLQAGSYSVKDVPVNDTILTMIFDGTVDFKVELKEEGTFKIEAFLSDAGFGVSEQLVIVREGELSLDSTQLYLSEMKEGVALPPLWTMPELSEPYKGDKDTLEIRNLTSGGFDLKIEELIFSDWVTLAL